MKHSLLYCLAAASLALSFFFDYTPDASVTPRALAPAVAEASLFPNLTELDPTAPPAGPEAAATASRDSLTYHYYGQTLGLKLAFTENTELLRTITDWLGTPYSSGSASRKGTDCSGFVTRVFKEVYGITLVHSSRAMFSKVKRVAKTDMKTGDLVFFRHGKGAIYHVGIYLKDGKFAHSASNGGVRVSSLHEAYYNHNFYAAGRVMAAARADAPAVETVADEELTASATSVQ